MFAIDVNRDKILVDALSFLIQRCYFELASESFLSSSANNSNLGTHSPR